MKIVRFNHDALRSLRLLQLNSSFFFLPQRTQRKTGAKNAKHEITSG